MEVGTSSWIDKSSQFVKLSFLASVVLCSSPLKSSAVDEITVTNVAGNLVKTSNAADSKQLTASDMLRSDVDFNVRELKDMEFVLEKVGTIIENRDYEAIRGVLRQEPLRNLRKTSKTLERFLPSKEIQNKFEESYRDMIDALDDLDYLATTRFRKEGVPKEGVPDTPLLNDLKTVISKLDEMIKVVPTS
jgi:hypothetical protein